MSRDEPSSVRMAGTLGVAGFVSGLVVVTVFEMTAPIIAENQARALEAGVLEVVPGAAAMQKLMRTGPGRIEVAPDVLPKGAEVVYAVYAGDGGFMGYALVGEGPGFQDTIRLIYGFNPSEGMIVGMQVLESRETPGLGDKIYKDPEFRANFHRLAVEPAIEIVEQGDERPNGVDGISGATISSRAVVKIINATNQAWLADLSPEAPALAAPAPPEASP